MGESNQTGAAGRRGEQSHGAGVLGLIAHGYSNQQIAAHLVLSPKTVRNHISSIFSKLQVVDRPQAIARGWGWGKVTKPASREEPG